jgi:hypothetical protein
MNNSPVHDGELFVELQRSIFEGMGSDDRFLAQPAAVQTQIKLGALHTLNTLLSGPWVVLTNAEWQDILTQVAGIRSDMTVLRDGGENG